MKSPQDFNKKNTRPNTHPDMRSDAPGRIPESLIDAAIDGELNDDMQREIAHALNYDPIRKQELLDTSDAINALQMPISMPDFSDVVLARADRHRRFIPATWRNHVRAGRLGIAAGLLVTLMTVAGLQRMYPRLTTIASHPTPVLDVQQAVGHDAEVFVACVSDEVEVIRESVASLLTIPGRTDQRYEVSMSSVSGLSSSAQISSTQTSSSYASLPADLRSSRMQIVSIGHGIAVVYIIHDGMAFSDSYIHADAQESLRLFASNQMGGWGSVRSSTRTTSRFPSISHQSQDDDAQDGAQNDAQVDIATLP